ncbi:hypothetical protein [Methylorubrum extorquens]
MVLQEIILVTERREKLALVYKAEAAERAKVLEPVLDELQAAGLPSM